MGFQKCIRRSQVVSRGFQGRLEDLKDSEVFQMVAGGIPNAAETF